MSTTEAGSSPESLENLSPFPLPRQPIPWPILVTVSGLYTAASPILPVLPFNPFDERQAAEEFTPTPEPIPGPLGPLPREPRLPWQPEIPIQPRIPRFPISEELRLDVDGHYPQMAASGVLKRWLSDRLEWIAELTQTGSYTWSGPITWKSGTLSLLPHTQVEVKASPAWPPSSRKATVTFSGGAAPRTRVFGFSSTAFRPIEFEFDQVEGVALAKSVATHDHPNHPSSLPAEKLTIERVFERTGFDVRSSGGDSTVPLTAAGADEKWTDQEMHDAMQIHWSRFANAPQWSLWTLFANQHVQGASLGGIMFDDIGPNHRQGTAIFIDSFISNVPPGDPAPDAFRARMQFWTAVHEMGHAFNLAHSWQKHLGNPWRPLSSEPEARSFMNYPYRVAGGQTAFFADFEYRFSDAELQFMRHAPERFVQQGNADWFDNHGFEQTRVVRDSQWQLEVRANRDEPEYEFLEPVMLELKLTNASEQPMIIDASRLSTTDEMTIIIKRQGQPAETFRPFARYCLEPRPVVVEPGTSLYEPLFVSAGLGGWGISEPGRYLVQIALHLDDEDVISAPMVLRVTPPRSYDEEYLAQDLFTEDVGRVLVFEGSRVLDGATATLNEAAERLADRRIAKHAQYALGAPLAETTKKLEIDEAMPTEAKITAAAGEPKAAIQDLKTALTQDMDQAAATFGHIEFKHRVDLLTDVLEEEGNTSEAASIQQDLAKTMRRRGVLERVVEEIDEHATRLAQAAGSRGKSGSRKKSSR